VVAVSFGTIFTLFVVPMFYTFLSSKVRKRRDEPVEFPPEAAHHPAPAE
jgi:hypothetical protein